MSPLFEPGTDAVRHERAVSSLCDRTGAPLAEVRSLFAQEFSKLEFGAKVRSYLAVLTASKVRAMLRRKDGYRSSHFAWPQTNHETAEATLTMERLSSNG